MQVPGEMTIEITATTDAPEGGITKTKIGMTTMMMITITGAAAVAVVAETPGQALYWVSFLP